MTTKESLFQRYGVLLSLRDCAELFCRSAEGLRVTLAGNNEFANRLRPAKVKLGRRILFKPASSAKSWMTLKGNEYSRHELGLGTRTITDAEADLDGIGGRRQRQGRMLAGNSVQRQEMLRF